MGVWIADAPLYEYEPPAGTSVVMIDLDEAGVRPFEWRHNGRTFREFLVPAELLNARGGARLLTWEETDRLSLAGCRDRLAERTGVHAHFWTVGRALRRGRAPIAHR